MWILIIRGKLINLHKIRGIFLENYFIKKNSYNILVYSLWWLFFFFSFVSISLRNLLYSSIAFPTSLINLKRMSASVDVKVYVAGSSIPLDSGRVKTVCLPLFSQGDRLHVLDKNTLLSKKIFARVQQSHHWILMPSHTCLVQVHQVLFHG